MKWTLPSPTITDGMITLGLDTSETIGAVGLVDEPDLAEEQLMDQPLQHAESLLPLIERLLVDCGLRKEAIGRVSVNLGPGSFTGLRIGLATAKGLCQALDLLLVGVDGTLVHRMRFPEARRICVILSNRRDLFYVRWFSGESPRGEIAVLRKDDLDARLDRESSELTLVGSGAPRVYERFHGHEMIRLAPDDNHRASALWVARAGAASEAHDQLHEAEPLYVEPILA